MPTRTKTVDTIYEHGDFRPTSSEPLDLAEGQSVRIVVQPLEQADAILTLAAEVYDGLTDAEIAEVEQHSAR